MSRPARQGPPRSAGVSPASNDLPRGWETIGLGELGMGRTQNIEPAKRPDEEFELWSVPSFPTARPEIVLGSAIGSNKQRVQPGDVLLCKINPRINRVWCVGPKAGRTQIASTEWVVFRSPLFYPLFLMWRFREGAFREALCRTVAGVGGSLTRARPKDVARIEIALPPLAEQRRIVARLERLEARSRRARAALQDLPALLAQARQSLLAAAFRGDLTKEWRRTHPDEEHGSSLVAALERAHQQAGGHKRGNAAQATEGVHDLTPADFPSSWGLTDLLNLCRPGKPITYGILMPGPDQPDGVPYVRVADFPGHEINLATVRRTTKAIDAAYARSRLSAGDLLLSIRGSVGRLATVPTELHGANITQDSVRLSIAGRLRTAFVEYMQFAVSMWGMFGLCRFLFPRLPSSARSCAASRRALPGSTRRKPRTKPQWQNWTGWINPCWRRPLPASSSPRTPATSPHPPSSPGFSLKTAVHKPQRSQRSRRKEVGGSQLKAIQNRLGTA